MAILSLSDTQSRTDFLHRRTIVNLQFWLDYVTANTADLAALNRERETIIKAISLGFNVEAARPLVEQLIISFSRYIERGGYWEAWNGIVRQALEVARYNGDVSVQVNLSGLLARLLKRQSRFQEAIRQHRRTIRLARQIGDTYNEARAWTNMGFLYIEQSQWYRAHIICCHALKMFEALGSLYGRAHTENHLGLLYTRQWRWNLAEQHLHQACALWQKLDDRHGLMHGFMNLGLLYNEMEQPNKALKALEKALQFSIQIGEHIDVGVIYLSKSDSFIMLADLEQAEFYARRAEAVFKQYAHWLYLPLAWAILGRVLLLQDKLNEANTYLQTALEKCYQLEYKYGEFMAISVLIEFELARNDPNRAAEWLKKLEQLINKYDRIEQQNHLQSVLTKYRRKLADKFDQTTTAVKQC